MENYKPSQPPTSIQNGVHAKSSADGLSVKPAENEKMESTFHKIWHKSGLDVPTLLLMAKGGLPPAIALAMLQTDAVAYQFTTIGFLVAIASILGMSIMPRAKFIQSMSIAIIFLCIGACIVLLMIYSAIKARGHSGHPTTTSTLAQSSETYSSSASVVCGVWLFFMTWLINTIRALYPQYALPTIATSIFVDVAAVYGPQFTNMAQGISFAARLLEGFLMGFAIACCVSFIVFPLTSRHIVFRQITAVAGLLTKTLNAHSEYFRSLGQEDISRRACEATRLNDLATSLVELQGKLQADMEFAKREVALGHLGPKDIGKIFKLMRAAILPVVGLASITDIFAKFSDSALWDWDWNPRLDTPRPGTEDAREHAFKEWNEIMQTVEIEFTSIILVMNEGLLHFLYMLKLDHPNRSGHRKAAPNSQDPEDHTTPRPGEHGFRDYFACKKEEFSDAKALILHTWCDRKGIRLPPDSFKYPMATTFKDSLEGSLSEIERTQTQHTRNQRQLFLLLFMDYLLYSCCCCILDLIDYADETAKSGRLDNKRFIVPGYNRSRKWLLNIFQHEDSNDSHQMMDATAGTCQVNLGEAYRKRKDPEHLPPETLVEKFGDSIRTFPRFLRSFESLFGLRVAVATLSIAVIGYCRSTQRFFIEQRFFWAMIMVTISMTPTIGQSIFNFGSRILGSAIAMAVCFPIYYIPNGHSAGIIVLLWLWIALCLYIPLRKPQFTVLGMISMVTTTLIIGYELEVKKIGRAVAESNGQPAYPIYLLAPYRLACVIGGLGVAFIWTFFPYPISDHSLLRQNLGASLYLLANYYSIVHETVHARIRGDEGDPNQKGSPGHQMQKVRFSVYGKQLMLLARLRANSGFAKWEVPVGGRFPRKQYDEIIKSVQNIHNYMSLVGYASQTFTRSDISEEGSGSEWFDNFRRLIMDANLTSHEITSLLSLLSSSMSTGQPLPPYLSLPHPYRLSQKLEDLDRNILSVRHFGEPGFAAFSVIQISTRCIIADLDVLLKNVKELIGELDFSFHTVSTQNPLASASEPSMRRASKRD